MKKLVLLSGVAMSLLSGCVAPSETDADADPSLKALAKLPPEVVAKVAPGQDTSDVRMDARDGCLMYRHNGPVETTFIPLRNAKGQSICVKYETDA